MCIAMSPLHGHCAACWHDVLGLRAQASFNSVARAGCQHACDMLCIRVIDLHGSVNQLPHSLRRFEGSSHTCSTTEIHGFFLLLARVSSCTIAYALQARICSRCCCWLFRFFCP